MRAALICGSVLLCCTLGPFGLRGLAAAGLGFFVALVILLAELRLRRAEISGLTGAACGAILGLLASLLVALVVSRTSAAEPAKSFLEFGSLFAFGYLGTVVGAARWPAAHSAAAWRDGGSANNSGCRNEAAGYQRVD